MKFKQCMTRGLTLIKMHFSDMIKLLTNDVVSKMVPDNNNQKKNVFFLSIAKQTPESMTESTETALLYVKFRALAPSLRTLVVELEQRASSAEYSALLDECINNYIAARTQLLGPSIDAKLDSQSKSLGLVPFVLYFLFYFNSFHRKLKLPCTESKWNRVHPAHLQRRAAALPPLFLFRLQRSPAPPGRDCLWIPRRDATAHYSREFGRRPYRNVRSPPDADDFGPPSRSQRQ